MSAWLLAFVPITLALEYLAPDRPLWLFVSSALAIVPLAAWMSHATEELASRTGEGVGGLLFVAPLLVLLSYAIAPPPMDLAFSTGLVLTVLLSVVILGQVAGDGRSDWLKGVQLLAVYPVLGLAFYFAPAAPGR
jgi:Ca2+:H+ antiporter